MRNALALVQFAKARVNLSLKEDFGHDVVKPLADCIRIAAGLSADRTNVFSTMDKAFYADQATLDFVRPDGI